MLKQIRRCKRMALLRKWGTKFDRDAIMKIFPGMPKQAIDMMESSFKKMILRANRFQPGIYKKWVDSKQMLEPHFQAKDIILGAFISLALEGMEEKSTTNKAKIDCANMLESLFSKLVDHRKLVANWDMICVVTLLSLLDAVVLFQKGPCENQGKRVRQLLENSLKQEGKENPSRTTRKKKNRRRKKKKKVGA